jgi:CubicO group peptidase (beta-lactamase class C family)
MRKKLVPEMDAALNKSLGEILNEYYVTGFFTHAHCLSGSLESSDTFAEVSISPDGANVFDLASLTKAICTAPLVYQLLQKLKLNSETATLADLFKIWPETLGNHFKSLQVKKLLRHESGLPAWRNFWMCRLGMGKECLHRVDRATVIIDKMNQLIPNELLFKPVYSDMGFILLGLALESFHEKDLADLFNEMVSSLNGPGITINFPTHIEQGVKFVPSAFCPIRQRLLVGEVHDENSASLGGQTGHAGLFGNVNGLSALLRWLYQDPTGRSFLEKNSNHIIANDAPRKPNESLFGWRQGADRSASGYANGQGMGHLGFTGTAFWVDWTEKRFAILLTNRVISGRVNRAIGDLRSRIFTALN